MCVTRITPMSQFCRAGAADDLVPRLHMSGAWVQLFTCLGSPCWYRGSLGMRLSDLSRGAVEEHG